MTDSFYLTGVRKYNQNHDPKNGRFTTGNGGIQGDYLKDSAATEMLFTGNGSVREHNMADMEVAKRIPLTKDVVNSAAEVLGSRRYEQATAYVGSFPTDRKFYLTTDGVSVFEGSGPHYSDEFPSIEVDGAVKGASDIAVDRFVVFLAANTFSQSWNQSTESLHSVKLQDAVQKAGLTKQGIYDNGGVNYESINGWGDSFADAYVKATYERTQDILKTKGIVGVTAYRGLDLGAEDYWIPESADEILPNALNAFSTEQSVAIKFASGAYEPSMGWVLRADIPAESIFSIGGDGVGAALENEIVVLGPDSWQNPRLGNIETREVLKSANRTPRRVLGGIGEHPSVKEVVKYNRNHDELGRFSSANSYPISSSDLADMQASSITGPHVVGGDFTPGRKALHDQIVADHLRGVKRSEFPTEYMNGGGPGSGKSSMTAGANAEIVNYPSTRGTNQHTGVMDFGATPAPDAVLIDPDAIKAMLPEVRAMRNAGNTSWAGESHAESSYLAKRIRREAFKRGVNIVNDGTGDSGLDKIKAKVSEARSHGYRTEANYLYLRKDEGVRRAESRAAQTGRHVPRHAIEAIYDTLPKIFPHLTEGVFDQLRVFDNNDVAFGEPARLIATTTEQGFQIMDEQAYNAFIQG